MLALFVSLMLTGIAFADDAKVEDLIQDFDRRETVATANAFLEILRMQDFFESPIRFTGKDSKDTLRQQVWYWAGEWYYDQSKYQQALNYGKKALPLFHLTEERADCLNLLAICNIRMGDYDEAAQYAKEVYRLDLQSGDADRQSSSLNTLGTIYLYANQPKEAEKYILRGIALAETTGNTARLAILKGKASEIYHAQGNDQDALRYAEAAYRLDKDAGREDKAVLRLAQKASVLIGLHQYKEAEQVLAEIIPALRKIGDRQSLGVACNKMGMALYSQKRDAEAVPYYREAVAIFSAIGDMANELHSHRGLYETLWKSNPDEAKRELDKFNDLKDSLYNNVSAESLAKYNAEFGNDWLQVENHEAKARLRLAVGLSAFLALMAMLIWLVMRRRHRRQTEINERLTSDIAELREKYNNLQIHYDNALMTSKNHDESERLNVSDQEFLEKTVNTINELIHGGQIDATTVAERLGMSLFQLRQRLGDVTGETPQSFIQMIRMRRARHLLDHHPELNVTEIGQLCAYQDTPNFTRAFKKMFGITPTQYLEKQHH